MASKLPLIFARLPKSNAPKILLRQNKRPMSTLEPSVKAKMDQYGLEDSTPVFKKNGTTDNLTYQITLGACLTSLALIAMNLSRFVFKK
ncbi:unnamed protein product [Nezara viridula]|uniref:Uncharacterized protein n=1 Tax=Nezara viridula TaxID=85310 RepID=A0A9P0MXA0_NEZVI|nr:unnamed protein product [Nezara viridula]